MDILSLIWSQVTFKDLLDITVVAALFYQMLLVIYGTRAVQMLIGIGALGLLFILGKYYELYSLTWILEHFFDALIILLVIIFQDQIRNTLATFGTGKQFFSSWTTTNDVDLKLAEVVDACSILSKNKEGGLIVFERRQGLMNYMRAGSLLDCNISADLLCSIFNRASPLHDGAVIISRERIGAAGCFLPLSKNLKLDKRFGTRHRAGIGVTEATDAVVIIVSEESGRMSVCKSGFVYEAKNVVELFNMVKTLWEKNLNSQADFFEVKA